MHAAVGHKETIVWGYDAHKVFILATNVLQNERAPLHNIGKQEMSRLHTLPS